MVNKKVLLFSGGLDSYCLKHIINPDIIVFCKLGTIDNEQELNNFLKMKINIPIKIIDSSFLSQFEMKNKIIPFRNNILTLIAAQYGNEIYFGATNGDTTKDKDFVFKAQMESILNYFALDKHKVNFPEYPYTIKMPFKNLTKTEIIKQYLTKGGNISDLLRESRSCYSGKEKECGICRSCLRKAIALRLNGIDISNLFLVDPFDNISKENHEKMLNRKEEKEEYLKIINYKK